MVKSSIRLAIVGLMLTALAVYAVEKHPGERWAHYTFEFGGRGENVGIEVLDWKFGDAPFSFMHAPVSGPVPQSGNAAGKMPVADSLYVKWRVLATGKVYQDKVDLRSRLPFGMEDKVLHFDVRGTQVYVYLIEGIDSKYLHDTKQPDCPLWSYRMFKCNELYPHLWRNF